jgi:hypothetical protein
MKATAKLPIRVVQYNAPWEEVKAQHLATKVKDPMAVYYAHFAKKKDPMVVY